MNWPFESLFGGEFTLSTQLIKPIYLVSFIVSGAAPRTAHRMKKICPRIAHVFFKFLVHVTILVCLRFVISSVFCCLRNFIFSLFDFFFESEHLYQEETSFFQVGFLYQKCALTPYVHPSIGIRVCIVKKLSPFILQISFWSCLKPSLFLLLGHVISITEIHQ